MGDSPILGAGLYVDGDVGAAGSTGRGEANLFGLCSFLIVENLRRGMTPKDAGMEALTRIKAATVERRLLNSRGEPNFNVTFYVLSRIGPRRCLVGAATQAGVDMDLDRRSTQVMTILLLIAGVSGLIGGAVTLVVLLYHQSTAASYYLSAAAIFLGGVECYREYRRFRADALSAPRSRWHTLIGIAILVLVGLAVFL